jgi:hypothetical protein
MNRRATSRFTLFVAGLAAVLCLQLGTARRAQAEPVLDASIVSGIDQDLTVIYRLVAGGFWSFGRFAPEAHIGFDGFLPLTSDAGITALSANVLDVGARYGLMSDHMFGAYLTAGAGFGMFFKQPTERKVDGAPDICESASIPEGDDPDQCAFEIDKNMNFRFGFGWGFAASKKATVGLRFDIGYWLLSVKDYEEQPAGAPIPRQIPRPQDAWSFMIGLEFMRWK